MKVRKLLLGLVGAAMGWFEPGGDDMVDLVNREGRRAEAADEIAGSPASGYRSEGSHFYTWQLEREEVADWLAELAPWGHPPRTSRPG